MKSSCPLATLALQRKKESLMSFLRGFKLGDVDGAAHAESWLAAGFMGIGELIVHGHGQDFDDAHGFAGSVGWLKNIFEVASRYHVPVLVHWEIGRVMGTPDNPNPSSPSDNDAQLLEVLSAYECVLRTGELKVILAHCGAGPEPYQMQGQALTDYLQRLDYLLQTYMWVYFDVAGMLGLVGDLGDIYGTPNSFGQLILDRMGLYPTRFMIGLDTEAKDDNKALAYKDSIVIYEAFLSSKTGTLSIAQQSWMWGHNTANILK